MISNTATFWSYLIILIPSIVCSLFVLYHLLRDRTLRQALNNHVIILILIIDLICEITIYPWMLYFYQHEGVWKRSLIFCEIWAFLDWGLYITHSVLFAWATIERHILIFHDKWVLTKKKRWFVHYLPLILILLYCLIFYSTVFFFSSCQNSVDNSKTYCIHTCLYNNVVYSMWELIVHQILTILTIVIFSIALLVRVLWQKHRLNQPVRWRKYRKMTIQLLSISFLYLIFCFPYTLAYTISLFGLPYEVIADFMLYSIFFSYFMLPLFSFVCVLSLPELRTKFINIFYLQRQVRRIGPGILGMKVPINNHIHVR